MKPLALDKSVINLIKQLRNQNISFGEIKKRTGTSKGTAWRIVHDKYHKQETRPQNKCQTCGEFHQVVKACKKNKTRKRREWLNTKPDCFKCGAEMQDIYLFDDKIGDYKISTFECINCGNKELIEVRIKIQYKYVNVKWDLTQ